MFGLVNRCARLERRIMDRDRQIARLNVEAEDLGRRLQEQTRANTEQAGQLARLRAEVQGIPRDPMDPIAAALEAVVLDLGASEWATPEHAEEILKELIQRHYNRGWTALFSAGATPAAGGR